MKEDMAEKNIARLLKESYRPADPSPEFERRLFALMAEEMRLLPTPRASFYRLWFQDMVAFQMNRQRLWAAVVLADVILIFLGVAFFCLMIPHMVPPPTLTPGEVAQVEPREGAVMPEYTPERGVRIPSSPPPIDPTRELAQLMGTEPKTEPRPDIAEISRWLSPPETAQFDPTAKEGSGLLSKSLDRRPFQIGSVLDTLAADIRKELAKREMVAVFLLDESRNLERDRKQIAGEIEKHIREIKKGLSKKMADRLELALVSFGAKPTLHLGPTGDAGQLAKAIPKIKSDPSGNENVIHAIQFALGAIKAGDKRLFLLLLTDEEGADTHNDALVDQALAVLTMTQARLYVFGKEAQFQQPAVREWLRDERGERVGTSEWISRGIESARAEFFTPDWLFSPYTGRNIPAGFGSFVLSMLARQSGGAYYMLRDVPSPYDETVLARYEPEWITRKEYDARSGRSYLRRSIRQIVEDWSKSRPSHVLSEPDRVASEAAEEIAKAERSAKLVERAIADLESSPHRGERFAPDRWEANYDLTLAELYKFRFLLREYVLVLKECMRTGFPKPEKNQKFNLYQICCDLRSTATHESARGRRDFEQAKRALEYVARKYKGTPWGTTAEQEQRYLSPLKVKPGFNVAPAKSKSKM